MPKTPIARALSGVKRLLILLLLMTGALDAFAVLLLSILVLRVFAFNWMYAWAPFGVMLVFGTIRGFRRASYRLAEERVPELQEQLRTVADNLARESIVLEALNSDVLGKVNILQPTVFVQMNKLTRQVIILAAISFAVLLVSAANVRLVDLPKLTDKVVSAVTGKTPFPDTKVHVSEEPGPTDIYGEASLAQLGLEELQLQFRHGATDVNINDVRQAEQQNFEEEQFPPEPASTAEGAFDAQAPRGYERLVQQYFSNVAQASARGG
jgi:hypothetical protein